MRRLPSHSMKKIFHIFALWFFVMNVLHAQSSPHGAITIPCANCHTTESWKELASPMKFNHSTTGFVLQGAHINVQCIQCHTTKKFTGTATDCFTCHQPDFNRALSPNHQLGKLSHDCLTCHTLNGWRPSVFQHSKTNFQLIGAHQSVDCASCHTNNRFVGLPNDCYTCHQQDYLKTTTPNHQTAQFNHDCMSCHTPNSWKPSTFDHNKTAFVLVGAHKNAECSSCHTNGRFKGLATDCYGCHQQDFAKTTTPPHSTGQFSHDCLTCHTVLAWNPAVFDHNKTNFQLLGAHVTAECSSCHVNGQFKGLSKECYPCHQTQFAKALTPNHTTGQFSHLCTECHTTTVWKPSTFDHNKTNYKLTGAHIAEECQSCHKNGQFKGTPSDCYTCHQTDFAKSTAPNHTLAQFSHDCTTCHTTVTWKPSTFNHSTTNFPLTGAHVAQNCESCHKNGQFKGTASDCYTCHQTDFNTTTTPNHALAQFSHDCLSCHSTTAWKPSTFNHSTTNFPLTGAHVAQNCESCHKNGQYKGTAADCYACHQADFNKTTAPNHALAQFSFDCMSCHNTTAWKPSTFNHSNTSFPLTGAHITTDCLFCHKNGQYKGTASDCYSCHQTDFAGVTDPNHVSGNFDHNCTLCHSTAAWSPATFDHNKSNFPLTGAHTTVLCSSCHVGGKYAGTSTDCFSCHQKDYTATTNPAHATANYPTTCTSCHTTNAWKPSTFNHTPFFPIGSGDKHRPGRWNFCSDCHTNPSNFKVFSCLTCHEHNQTDMDKKHQGRNGYSYDSNACYRCHPQGRE